MEQMRKAFKFVGVDLGDHPLLAAPGGINRETDDLKTQTDAVRANIDALKERLKLQMSGDGFIGPSQPHEHLATHHGKCC